METTTCEQCAMTLDPADCGVGEYAAHWVGAAGEVSEGTYMVCQECLEAGDPEGPGYRVIDSPET